jgi:hypothetical protein
MSKPSEIAEFIRGKLGRTSSKLVQSFCKHCELEHERLNECYVSWRSCEWWERMYPMWIKTVRQNPNRVKKTQGEIDLARVYRTVGNLTKALEAEREKTSRLGDRVKQLEKENARLQTIKNNYIAPPPDVLRAMAVFGD